MRITNQELDREIADLLASGADPARLELLMELRELRSWWITRLSRAIWGRLISPSMAGWCLIICVVTFVLGAAAAIALPTRTVSALSGGVSILFLALGLLLRPSGQGVETRYFTE